MFLTDFVVNILTGYLSVFPTVFTDLLAVSGDLETGLGHLGAGLGIIGVLGAGIGQGMAGQGACLAIGRNPEVRSQVTSVMIIAAGIAESGAIYALVVSILLIFVV